MRVPSLPILAAALCVVASPLSDALAQRVQTFQVRLAATPRDTAMRATIAGSGSAEVMLTGRELAVRGTFAGLKSQATQANIHMGPATAVRGPAVYALNIVRSANGTDGTILGTVELSDQTFAALQAGHLYIQIDSEGAPDGNLWGWLFWEAR